MTASTFGPARRLSVLGLLLGLLAPGFAQALEPRSFPFQEAERRYLIHNAEAAQTSPRPLVVALHGYSGKGEEVRGEHRLAEVLWSRLDQIAEREGFVTVYPVALHGQWNLFPGLRNTELESGQPVDDVGFILALVEHLVAEGLADPSRIYLTGLSDGAILTYRMLCRAPPSPFAAAVALIGSMHQSHYEACTPATPVPLLVIAGTADPILPYDGWIFSGGREVSIPETLELWRRLHGCSGQQWALLDDPVADDGSRARLVTWTGCARDGSVKLLRLEGAGHQAPSRTPSPQRWIERFGPRNQDIEGADEVWQFLSGFSK